MAFLLRFEATAFDSTVFDMPRLSPIRGASLSYLYSPDLVKRTLDAILGADRVVSIYAGASQGAWRLEASSAEAGKAAAAVREALRTNDTSGERPTGVHRHLSYVVSLADGDDQVALAEAEALNALATMQEDSFPLPPFNRAVRGFDRRGDRLRPADTGKTIHGETVSTAHRDRHDFGRLQRQRFYARGGAAPERDFADNFEEIVADPPDGLPASARAKLAVFYADGNRLGAHRDRALAEGGGLAGLSDFSERFKSLQTHLLAAIVGWLNEGLHARRQVFANWEGAFRFETLMWGGDEILFVMPAWLGLEFAERFEAWTEDWAAVDGTPITFSAGLVIANHKTPVRLLKNLAESLAETGKDLQPAKTSGRTVPAFDVEVFESVAVPESDLAAYRRRLYHAAEGVDLSQRLCRTGRRGASSLRQRIETLKRSLPRSQLYGLLRVASETKAFASDDHGSNEAVQSAYDLYRRRAGEGTAPPVEDLILLDPGEGQGDVWPSLALNLAVLAMLWDYVVPLDQAEGRADG